jgi:hypothetical protein
MAFHFPLDKLMQDPYDVIAWHLLLLYPNGVSLCPLVVEQWGIGKCGFNSCVF